METSSALNAGTVGLFTDGLKKKILLVPGDAISCTDKSSVANEVVGEHEFQLTMYKFPHPRTGSISVWDFSEANGKIYQLFQLDEKFRSWFVGDYVIEDGTMKCLVPLDPLFLVIPHLLAAKKRKRFQPLRQILLETPTSSEEFADTVNLLTSQSGLYLKDLDLISSMKDFKGETFLKLSRAKLTTWMKVKVKILAESLEREQINAGSKVTVAGYSRKSEICSKEQYERYAFGILSDMLPVELREELTGPLGFGQISVLETTSNASTKKQKCDSVEVLEDYSKSFKPPAPTSGKKLTTAQKQLLKVDKTGMKSISSYFTRTADKAKK